MDEASFDYRFYINNTTIKTMYINTCVNMSHRGCPTGRPSAHSSLIWSCLLNWSNMTSSISPLCTSHVTSHDHVNHTHSPETVPQLVLSIHQSPAQHLMSGRQIHVCHEDVASIKPHLPADCTLSYILYNMSSTLSQSGTLHTTRNCCNCLHNEDE